LWAVYRYITGVVLKLDFGEPLFYFLHIIAAPTFHLTPIFVFWWMFWKEPTYFECRQRGETVVNSIKKSFPFVITKKLLLSGMIIGFIAAIVWRLLEEFLFIGFAGAAGATIPETFTFLNIMETLDMILLMTLVMYFVVGPVEEIQFRGFAYDQIARATPRWFAVLLSSILFGCSHIPIAIFVYELEGPAFVAALYSWIAAGVTFAVLYMYSRQIFAVIVMHGMGNWQLSIYYYAIGIDENINPITLMGIEIAVATIANGIMILLFFLINEFYWQPHRRGEPAFGGIFMGLQTYIRDHDFNRKTLTQTFTVAIVFMFLISAIIMGLAGAFGIIPPDSDDESDSGNENWVNVENMEETPEQVMGSEYLNEGVTTTLTYDSEPGSVYIRSVSVTLTWTDETSQYPRFTNEPDTFSITISGLNGTTPITTEASNPTGGTGTVSADYSLSLDDIQDAVDNQADNYTVSVEITMVEAGDYEKTSNLPGAYYYNDFGNQYDYTIDIIWLTVPEE
jgi:membrane protease YdiL (CAAX protease family)